MLKHDPVEDTPEYKAIEQELEAKLEKMFENEPKRRGFCRKYWNAKREILKYEYKIEWRSPAVMNPRVRFD